MNEQEARQHIFRGFKLLMGREPSVVECQVIHGVSWLETAYGAGWKNEGRGSNNMGAVQSGKPPCNPATSFTYTDTRPTSGGGSIPYSACFKKYPTAADGFADVVRNVFVSAGIRAADAPASYLGHRGKASLEAATKHDLHGVSEAMYDGSYYQGFGPNRATRVSHHYRALRSAVNKTAATLGEKMPNGNDPLKRVLKYTFPLIMRGDDVKRVQRIVFPEDIDGWFGPGTKKRVMNLQASTPGLEVDGVVGLDTWDVIQDLERQLGYVLEAA